VVRVVLDGNHVGNMGSFLSECLPSFDHYPRATAANGDCTVWRCTEAFSLCSLSQSSSPVLLLSSPRPESSAPVDGKGVAVEPSAVLIGQFFDPSRKMEAREGQGGDGFGPVKDEGV